MYSWTPHPKKKEVKSSSNLFWDNIAPPFQVPYCEKINEPLIFSVLDVSNVQREYIIPNYQRTQWTDHQLSTNSASELPQVLENLSTNFMVDCKYLSLELRHDFAVSISLETNGNTSWASCQHKTASIIKFRQQMESYTAINENILF